MLIVLKVYLDKKRIQIKSMLFVAEAGFEPVIVCILLVPPPWNFLRSYWLVSALHLSTAGLRVLGERDDHYTKETCRSTAFALTPLGRRSLCRVAQESNRP